jgi:hypothetical protein
MAAGEEETRSWNKLMHAWPLYHSSILNDTFLKREINNNALRPCGDCLFPAVYRR